MKKLVLLLGGISFRGFCGRYRLSWTGVDGNQASKLVEVR